jgi:hypothetical protein
MRTVHSALLAGVAAAAVAGSALAAAKAPSRHEMTVQLPWGGVAHIEYAGDIVPKVTIDRDLAPFGIGASDRLFTPDAAFTEMQRISADMDREFAAMERQAEQVMRSAPRRSDLYQASTRNLPAGSESYSMVSTYTSNGTCTQSVQITTPANGGKPEVVRHSSGNCGTAHGRASEGEASPSGSGPSKSI